MPKLAHWISRSVVVAAPGVFGGAVPRRCTLVDIEPSGVWISGEDVGEQLAKVLGAAPTSDAVAAVFVPFAQIGFLFAPAQVGARAGVRAGEAKAGKGGDEAHAAARGKRSHPNRSKRKASKPAR